MEFNEYDLYGEVYAESKGIYFVKIQLSELWISGITVRKSTKYPGTWWAQMPHFPRPGQKTTYYIETVDGGGLRRLIEQRAIELVNEYLE